ncbi:MAG: electron transport complex subunit RsxC [Parasporobacterium sp.]|nr:electron transport complex subunit RsxC [Parasporobacterium sp.]
MAAFTFKGGVHPQGGKDMSKDKPVTDYHVKGELVFPLSQSIGAPAEPVVQVGDHVNAGTLIAAANGFVSANIYASTSGTVKAIEPRLVTNGSMVMSIVIDNDQLHTEEPVWDVKPYEEMTPDEIKELVQKAGVVGMGGATFPTHVKLAPKDPDKIDYVIVNGAECEPYLTSDYRRLLEEPESVILGLKVILKCFPNARGVIAIEDNKPQAIAEVRKHLTGETKISLAVLKTKYPQGSERHLIYAVTKRKINSSMLPADAGCIVDNVDTVYSVKRAVVDGKPLMHRIVTVTGDAVNDPRNFRVPIGTNMQELVDAAGGFNCEPEKIIIGGPMMGIPAYTLDIPIMKGSSAITVFKKDPVAHVTETHCISCGKCVEICPSRLIPSMLADSAQHNDLEKFNSLDGVECVECGSCSFICPAKRQLAQSIKTMRKIALAARRK